MWRKKATQSLTLGQAGDWTQDFLVSSQRSYQLCQPHILLPVLAACDVTPSSKFLPTYFSTGGREHHSTKRWSPRALADDVCLYPARTGRHLACRLSRIIEYASESIYVVRSAKIASIKQQSTLPNWIIPKIPLSCILYTLSVSRFQIVTFLKLGLFIE